MNQKPLASFSTLLAICVLIPLSVALAGCPAEVEVGHKPKDGKKSGLVFDTRLRDGQGDTVATIGEEKLTIGDLQGRLDRRSPFIRARYKDLEKRVNFLDEQVRFEVLAKEAAARGLHMDPEVQEAVKKIIVQKLTREEFEGQVKTGDVTDVDMKAYYDGHVDEYVKPEMFRAGMIKIPFGDDKAKAKSAITEAQKYASNKDTLGDRKHFRNLVTKYSQDDETRKLGGDLRYLSAAEYTKSYGEMVQKAVWALPKVNDISGVIEGPDAFYVLKKTGERKPITREYEKVKNQIRNLLFRDKKNDAFNGFIDELKAKYNVKTMPEALSKLEISADLPNGMVQPGQGGDSFGHPPPHGP